MMAPFEGLLYGLKIALQPEMLLAAFIGVAMGSLFGVLPGLGPLAGASILFPLTYVMGPTAGLIMIAGIYYGVMYGGSTTAILLNIPGEVGSVPAAVEGYPMAQQGRAGPALGIVAFGSFFAGTIAVGFVTLASPFVARIGLLFGPAEYFALMFGGLILLSRVFGGSISSGLLPMLLGLMIATIGQDITSARYRFAFGEGWLIAGIGLVPLAIGLFGITEILHLSQSSDEETAPIKSPRVRDLLPSRSDLKKAIFPWLRGSVIGFLFGLLPGPSGTMSSFVSYRAEKELSRNKEEFGHGSIAGLASPEAANNAAATSSLIPILSLGVPFSATLALMLGALIVHGINPGPQIASRHPEIFWGVIASLYIGNVMLVVINVPMIGLWVRMLQVPKAVLIPTIVVLSAYGTFAVSRQLTDMIVLMLAGFIGYLFRLYGLQLAPIILGVLLGPLIERNFISALRLSRGAPDVFWASGVSIAIWSFVILFLLVSFLTRRSAQIRGLLFGAVPETDAD